MKNSVKTEIAVKTEILSSEDGNRTYSIKKEITGIAGSHEIGRASCRERVF